MRLWLECRVTLARSLIGTCFGTEGGEGGVVVDCGKVCGEGLRESGACGEGEVTAILHHIAALHAMAQDPPDLETVSTHSQVHVHHTYKCLGYNNDHLVHVMYSSHELCHLLASLIQY